jgi:hypothetical protein
MVPAVSADPWKNKGALSTGTSVYEIMGHRHRACCTRS